MRRVFSWVLTGLAIAAGAPAASAGMLDVSPIMVEMIGGARATTLSISNPDASAGTVQLRVFAWDQAGGTDSYRPTTDVLVSPPMFTLPPGQVQVVRVVATGAPAAVEQSYRLLIDQVPDSARAGTVQVPIRLDLPVFLVPAAASASALSWQARKAGGEIHLSATNTGQRRARLGDLTLTGRDGRPVAAVPGLSGYVLAGQTRTWRLPASAFPDTLQLRAVADTGPLLAEVPLDGR